MRSTSLASGRQQSVRAFQKKALAAPSDAAARCVRKLCRRVRRQLLGVWMNPNTGEVIEMNLKLLIIRGLFLVLQVAFASIRQWRDQSLFNFMLY
mmetsp:Transcript_8515/g.18758  ORF Transcript_8515/g.18758 Transcript_8515/m.18758 type:complete len:95 (-) Transcript_8515:156-440(-)